jgi:hypothetical protein
MKSLLYFGPSNGGRNTYIAAMSAANCDSFGGYLARRRLRLALDASDRGAVDVQSGQGIG